MTFKELAEAIAEEEGLKEQLDIAQIKEVLKITLSHIAIMSYSDLGKLLKKYE